MDRDPYNLGINSDEKYYIQVKLKYGNIIKVIKLTFRRYLLFIIFLTENTEFSFNDLKKRKLYKFFNLKVSIDSNS